MADLNRAVLKLIQALNTHNYQLLYHKKQFMGKEGMPHNLFVLSKAVWDEDKGKYGQVEVYKTTSLIRMVLYLRDMWSLEQGEELPQDNEVWNQIRKKEGLWEDN